MTLTLTLDTNCVIAVDERRPESHAILELAAAHSAGSVSVALVAISASERQQDGTELASFAKFRERLHLLGLGHLELLKPLAYYNLCYFDWCLYGDDHSVRLEQTMHQILFPDIPFHWADFCRERGINQDSPSVGTPWRNAKCDVLAYWSHIHSKRQIFVTSDGNFHKATKKNQLLKLFGGDIVTPGQASQLP